MKTIPTYILLLVLCIYSVQANSQTPFDSFAPEVSRPMLDLDFIRARNAYHAQKVASQDTILFFVDITNGNIIASAPLADELRKWLSVDPLSDKYPNISPYAYCSWNPIKFVDPDGRDEEQRQLGIEKAWEYVKQNPNKSSTMYELGEKGGPGQKVDCSGLGSNCAIAGGEKDPNYGDYNGVRNIANNTQKIENMNDIEAGNFVMFGNYSHMGIITDVIRDDFGNVIDFEFVHSGTSTGPIMTYGSKSSSKKTRESWMSKVVGFYKWDTRPDCYNVPTLSPVTVIGKWPYISEPTRSFKVEPLIINFNLYIRR